MKIIDLLNKIANGEIKEDTLIEFDNGYKDYCSVRIFFDRYIVDRENLNCEVEIIEEEKKYVANLISQDLEKDKEIERLNKECDTYMKIATKKDNIINNIKKEYELFSQSDFNTNNCITFINNIKKELKEKSD